MTAIPFSKTRFKADTSELALNGWDNQADAESWIKALRLSSRDKISEFGLPTPKLERWKFTNLTARLKKMNLSYSPVGATSVADAPDWVRERIDAAVPGENPYHDMMLWDANNAFLDRATFLQFTDSQHHNLVHVGKAGEYTAPRTFICVADNADAVLFEYYSGEGAYWRNGVTEIRVGKNARFRHYRIQEDSTDSVYTQNTHVTIERDGNYEAFTFTSGAGLSRNQMHGELQEQNGQCSFSGLNMAAGKQHMDTTLLIEHQAPHCQSNQLYKTILDGEARGVFQGKIHVHQIAQKTDGYQLSNNLLLSPLAEMNIKPELEIYADDVKCSHGSTTGQLDETPLFYLRSRGLNETEARRLLLEAFIGEAFEKITHEAAHKEISDRAIKWLHNI